jgi:hypothetical protein
MCTAQESPELMALIAAQARDAMTTQWKHNPGLNDDLGLPIGRRWRSIASTEWRE